MRTLSSTLTTAQESAARTPYIILDFTSRDRKTTRSFDFNFSDSVSTTKHENQENELDDGAALTAGTDHAYIAQTFTAGSSYKLTAIALLINWEISGTEGNVTVSLKAVDGNSKPTGADLASKQITVIKENSSIYRLVNFDASVQLTSGTEYAIIVKDDGGAGNPRWDRANDTTFAGRPWWSSDGSTWATPNITDPERDMTFKVFSGDANHILMVKQAEGRFGGVVDSLGGVAYSTLIHLADPNNDLINLDWKGYRVDIGWGFNTTAGDEISESAVEYVFNYRHISRQGILVLELYCISLWDLISIVWPNDTTGIPVSWRRVETVRNILMELLGGAVPLAAIQDDGGVFTDETTDAGDIGTNDVNLLPATPATSDAFYFGLGATFNRVSIDMTTVGVGVWTLAWEYWNGSAWSGLTFDISDITDFKQSSSYEVQFVSFRLPTDWATTTINSQGPYYYVRARVSAFTSITTQPKATIIYLGTDRAIAIDSTSSLMGDDIKPFYETNYRMNTRDIVKFMLELTLLGIVLRNEGFRAVYIDNASVSADYTYDTDHAFYVDMQEIMPVLPNKVVYIDRQSGGGGILSGEDTDSDSKTAFGEIVHHILDDSITTGAEATTLAQRHIKRLVRDANQGIVEVPMNVGQEIWDLVKVIDSRTGKTYLGRVSALTREYWPGHYELKMRLGGYEQDIWTERGLMSMPIPAGTMDTTRFGRPSDIPEPQLVTTRPKAPSPVPRAVPSTRLKELSPIGVPAPSSVPTAQPIRTRDPRLGASIDERKQSAVTARAEARKRLRKDIRQRRNKE